MNEQRLLRTWYGGEPPAAWQHALAALHGAVRWMYPAERPQRTPAGAPPLVVVGNLTVGGTGKTPLVIWLCQQLAALGLRVAVVSRGYGGSHSRGEGTLRVARDTPASVAGDEPLLVHLRTGVPVYVARRRMEAATRAAAGGAQVIIADDGLQHSLLPRDVELAVVDGVRGFGNGRLLPAGPLRDPLERLDLVDAIVVNGGATELAAVPGLARWLPGGAAAGAPPVLRMRLEGSTLRSLADPARTRPLAELEGQRVHAVAALGHPQRFFATLAAAGLEVTGHAHRDHAPLPPAALSFGDGLPVLLSEKDAVKCPPTGLPPGLDAWVLPVDATFGGADARALLGRVLMDARLLELLACPLCKGPLRHVREEGGEQLVCRADRLAYPVRDGVPVMLEEEARALPAGDPLLER